MRFLCVASERSDENLINNLFFYIGFQYQRNVRTKNEIFTEVSGYEWDGMIDEFKIFNRSLSPIEIATEMNVLNILNINSTFSKESSLVNYKDSKYIY